MLEDIFCKFKLSVLYLYESNKHRNRFCVQLNIIENIKVNIKILSFAPFWIMVFVAISCNESNRNNNQGDSFDSKKYEELVLLGIDHGFPGFIVAVQTKEDPIWVGARGHASLEEDRPMQKNDRFHIASKTYKQ